MNWDAIGAIGEILGAGAVVVSLFYLASQIRTQNKEARLAAMHEILTAFREASKPMSDGELADIFVRGNKDIDSLSDTEILRLIAVLNPVIRVLEEAYDQYTQGRLHKSKWDGMVRQYSSYMSAPCFQHVWGVRRNHYQEDFRSFVDDMENPGYKIR